VVKTQGEAGVSRTEIEVRTQSRFKMIDVGSKTPTRRYAVASGRIRVGKEAFLRIKEGRMPKGDVLALAEAAGIMAAKRAPDLIPLCHPLSLEQVVVRCDFVEGEHAIEVRCEAVATSKTGVEMEALAGVSGALLSIYDLTKGVNPALWISDIHLQLKEGGKSGKWVHPESTAQKRARERHVTRSAALNGLTVAVLTISDRVSKGLAEDASGPAVNAFFMERGAQIAAHEVIADEKAEVAKFLRHCALEANIDIIVSTGGTGVGPRDVTPEALVEAGARMIPGIGELLRSRGSQTTPMSWLSRSEGALLGRTLILILPGSPNAVIEGLLTMEPLIPHALHVARGGGHAK